MASSWAFRSALQIVVDIIAEPFKLHSAMGKLGRRREGYNARLDVMSLISGNHLSKSYGAENVFSDVSVHVPHQARIGLVGLNGVGKSTLLRVLAQLEQPDSGRIQRARKLTIGHLPQEVVHSPRLESWMSLSLWQLAQGAFSQLQDMESELRQLESSMADPRQAASAMSRYGELQESFELAGGYEYLADARRVLRGVGFEKDEFDRRLSTFSGGERTRALLARLLLEDPDVLILDEPTNHLDIDSVNWLESWLSDWPGAAIVVSHDRYFLDQVIDTIWDLTREGLDVCRGGYSEYAIQRSENLERRLKVYRQQQERIAKEQEFIQRNLAGQNTRQAQGRRTRLQRFLEEDAIRKAVDPKEASITFEAHEQTGNWALRMRDVTIGRGNQALFAIPDLEMARGERVAILGPNGVGKSTLLRTLTGELKPIKGEIGFGPNVTVGYFAQAHSDLDPSLTVLESMLKAKPDSRISEARDLLGRYLFSGDHVDKQISSLSGGERGRLALAQLAVAGANLLLLDEPTNHLDLMSQESLQSAIDAFQGTAILVSHDRYLVRALATQIWAVLPTRERLEVIRGGYDEFRSWRESMVQQERADALEVEQPAREKPRHESTLHRALEAVELEVQSLETKLAQLAAEIETIGEDRERVSRLGERYAEVEDRLKKKLAEWEGLSRQQEDA
jgi:ATP-binding cassette subfamily F protein 3